jgi:hypothetical protein
MTKRQQEEDSYASLIKKGREKRPYSTTTLPNCIVCYETISKAEWQPTIDECPYTICAKCARGDIETDETGAFIRCGICRRQYRIPTFFTNKPLTNEDKCEEYYNKLSVWNYPGPNTKHESKREVMQRCDFVYLDNRYDAADYLECLALAVRLNKPLFLNTEVRFPVNFTFNRMLDGQLKDKVKWVEMREYVPRRLQDYFPTV